MQQKSTSRHHVTDAAAQHKLTSYAQGWRSMLHSNFFKVVQHFHASRHKITALQSYGSQCAPKNSSHHGHKASKILDPDMMVQSWT